jgi:hypothetical protein
VTHNHNPTDEFWSGVWWVPNDGADRIEYRLRSATLGECAAEIQRLRARVAELEAAATSSPTIGI